MAGEEKLDDGFCVRACFDEDVFISRISRSLGRMVCVRVYVRVFVCMCAGGR